MSAAICATFVDVAEDTSGWLRRRDLTFGTAGLNFSGRQQRLIVYKRMEDPMEWERADANLHLELFREP